MALLRRAPREVYRVFSESDFLAGGDGDEQWQPVATDAGAPRGLHRIAAGAMLAGAVAAVGAELVLHGTPSRATVRPFAPPAMAGARPRLGSAGEVARVSGNRHAMRRAVEPRRGRTVTAMSSAGRSPAVGVPAPAVNAVAGNGSSSRLEPAEFSFER
jgi:hypothetical protein